MGRITDFFFGPELSDPESSNAPQGRSATPYVADNGTIHDGSTVNDIPSRDPLSQAVPEGKALSLIATYRAANIISTSVMQLTLDAYRDDEEIDRPAILKRPDPDESRSAFLEKTALCLVLNGNFFWRVFRDNQGRVTVLRVLNPLDVTIEVDSFGGVTGYKVAGYTQTFSRTEIKHGSLMRVPGEARGRGPIQACAAEIRGALDGMSYGANWFQDAGVPSGILSSDRPLTEGNAELLREQWTKTRGGTRGTAVLGDGYTYSPVYLSPEDAQWIAARQFDTTAIARLFGIPAGLMLAAVEGSSMTYSNISQAWTEFQRFSLVRYTREIEEAFSDVLPRGTEARFNLSGLLRPDDTTRWAIHTQALTAGVLSVNEVRAIENLPPVPGGDHKTEQELAEEATQIEQASDETPAPDEEEAGDE